MKYAFYVVLIFFYGTIAGLNIAGLFPSAYNVAWWKVGLSIFFAVFFASFAKEAVNGRNN